MLNLTFNEPPEIKLPTGETYLVVGVTLKDIKKVINLQSLQTELNKMNKTKKEEEENKSLTDTFTDIPDEIIDLMDEVIDLGLIDKETEQPAQFPRKYRNLHNDMELSTAIMQATMSGGPKSDPLPQTKAKKRSSRK